MYHMNYPIKVLYFKASYVLYPQAKSKCNQQFPLYTPPSKTPS